MKINLNEKLKKIISARDLAYLATYSTLWIFPILISWIVASNGKFFSFGALQWQLINLRSISLIIIVSFFISLFTGLLCSKLIQKYWKLEAQKNNFDGYKYVFLFILSAFSLVGLFLSFGGTIFEKAYSGANYSWLDIGAYNIVFDIAYFSISLIVLRKYGILICLFLNTLVFLPVLACGSRIDFTSVQLAILIFLLFVEQSSLKKKFISIIFLMLWTFAILQIIGQIRNQYAEAINSNIYSVENLSYPPIRNIPSANTLYLGTLGNIGLSFFQIYGLVAKDPKKTIGLKKAFNAYAIRLIPGPLLKDRPRDFSGTLPEIIGVGATHSLAEGYLIKGLAGVILISIFFGLMGGCSLFFLRRYENSQSIKNVLLFSFPWILLIRGGWYQLFAIFKASSFLIALLLIFYFVDNYIYARSGQENSQ